MKKRISAMLLSIALVLSMFSSAMAATSIDTITVEGAEDAYGITVSGTLVTNGTYWGAVWKYTNTFSTSTATLLALFNAEVTSSTITSTAVPLGYQLQAGDNLRVTLSLDESAGYYVDYTVPANITTDPTNPGPTGGGGGGTPTYAVNVDEAENGAVTVSPKSAKAGDDVTVTATPDEGYELDKLTVTDKDGKEVKLTDNGDGTFTFEMPKGKVTVEASFTETEQPPVDPGCPGDSTCPVWAFSDTNMEEWYHDGVHYCVENGIMNGYPGGLFGPADSTTRAQLVTMLHRLEGAPAPAGEVSFTDAPASEWYFDAVLWAAENAIVTGYGDGSFGPNDPVTREQLVTILWRYAAYKGVDVSAGADLSGYTDAGHISDWAVDAMAWAIDAGIINGTTDTTLSPQSNATRAQIAAIFQRYCEGFAV